MSHEYSFTSDSPNDKLFNIFSKILNKSNITLTESNNGGYSLQNDNGWPNASIYFDPIPHFSFNFSPKFCVDFLKEVSTEVNKMGWTFTWEEL